MKDRRFFMRAKQALKPRRRGAPSLVQAAPRKRRFGFLLKATCVVVILVLTLTLGFMLGAIQSYDDSNPARVPGEKPAGPRLPSLPKLNAFFGAAHGEAAAGLEQEELKAGEEEKARNETDVVATTPSEEEDLNDLNNGRDEDPKVMDDNLNVMNEDLNVLDGDNQGRFRIDNKCGPLFKGDDGVSPEAECDPLSTKPCCSPFKLECGGSVEFCECIGCVDFRKAQRSSKVKDEDLFDIEHIPKPEVQRPVMKDIVPVKIHRVGIGNKVPGVPPRVDIGNLAPEKQREFDSQKFDVGNLVPAVQREFDSQRFDVGNLVPNVQREFDSQRFDIGNLVPDVWRENDLQRAGIGNPAPDAQQKYNLQRAGIGNLAPEKQQGFDIQRAGIGNMVPEKQQEFDVRRIDIGNLVTDEEMEFDQQRFDTGKLSPVKQQDFDIRRVDFGNLVPDDQSEFDIQRVDISNLIPDDQQEFDMQRVDFGNLVPENHQEFDIDSFLEDVDTFMEEDAESNGEEEEAPKVSAELLEAMIKGRAEDTIVGNPYNCYCGQANKPDLPNKTDNKQKRVKRMINANKVQNENQYPWMLELAIKRQLLAYCGATLLNSQWALTSAGCARIMLKEAGNVLFEQHRLIADDGDVFRKVKNRVKKIIIHPGYSLLNKANNIALLKLQDKVKFSDKVRPICLPSMDPPTPGKIVKVSGWGEARSDTHLSRVLRSSKLTIMDTEECNARYYYNELNTSTVICTWDDGKKGPCHGDQGGSMVLERGGSFEFIGITLWGSSCGTIADTYANVRAYMDWFLPIAGPPECPRLR